MILFYRTNGIFAGYVEGFDTKNISIPDCHEVHIEEGSSLDYLARQFEDPTHKRVPSDYVPSIKEGKLCLEHKDNPEDTHWLES